MGCNGPNPLMAVKMMTMRNIILFAALVCSPFKLMAETPEVNLAKMQEYLDKNQLEKVEDLYDENEETLSKNWMALERLAISLERREKYKEAIEIYRKIIVSFHRLEHVKILSAKPKAVDPSLYENNKLPFYYYKLSYASAQLFLATSGYTPVKERIRLKNNTEGFIALARKVQVEESDLKILEQIMKEKIVEEQKRLYTESWYASVDLISWQDRVKLITIADGTSVNLLSTAMGTCVGGGKKWENVNYEFNIEACYAVGSATISSEVRSEPYQQSSVAVNGFIVGPGIYYKSLSDTLLVGIHLPIKYRSGDWTNPDEEKYRFDGVTAIEAGFFLQSKIKINKVALRTRLGKVFPNPGSLWSVGLLYDF